MDALGKSFNCDNCFSIGALGRINTRDDRLAIHKDSTCSALSFLTADLSSREAKSLAQNS
jgi:hypothetical protein